MTADSSSISWGRFNANPFCKSCGLRLEEVESAGDSPANRTITIVTDCKERHFTGQVGCGTQVGLKCAMEWECHHGVISGQNGDVFCSGAVTCKKKKNFISKLYDIALLLMNTLSLWMILDQVTLDLGSFQHNHSIIIIIPCIYNNN